MTATTLSDPARSILDAADVAAVEDRRRRDEADRLYDSIMADLDDLSWSSGDPAQRARFAAALAPSPADAFDRPRPPRWLRRSIFYAALIWPAVILGLYVGRSTAPDPARPDPIVVVCQEQDPALCAEMPAVR